MRKLDAMRAPVNAPGRPPIPMDERVLFNDVAVTCAAERLVEGLQMCMTFGPRDRPACAQVCSEASTTIRDAAPENVAARAREAAEQAAVDAASSRSRARAVPAPAPSVAPPIHKPDAFELALASCITGVWQANAPPVCHFARPLDDMGFGQRHCDERCRRVTGGTVTSAAGP
jgi:hypothetical protein